MINSETLSSQRPLNTAVLLIVFNRPDATQQVFEAIRKAKPPRLYVAADGARPNRPGESELCEQVRRIATSVDWSCEVKKCFRLKNQGCGPSVKSAIDWFFEHEKFGIILEDDTLPAADFFNFCEEILVRYQNDSRVAMIAGTNHIGYVPKDASYLFSKNKACWGWATWRRAWSNMDFSMSWRDSRQYKNILLNMGSTNHHLLHWRNALSNIDRGLVNAWDWQWYFSIACQNQLTIFPAVNLVSNIGFGENATHTKGRPRDEYLSTKPLEFPLTHPKFICPDYDYDIQFESIKMRRSWIKKLIPTPMKKLLRRILK